MSCVLKSPKLSGVRLPGLRRPTSVRDLGIDFYSGLLESSKTGLPGRSREKCVSERERLKAELDFKAAKR